MIIALKQYRLYHSNDTTLLAWLQISLFTWLAIPAVMTSYSSWSKISIISVAVITCGSFGKCLRLPVSIQPPILAV